MGESMRLATREDLPRIVDIYNATIASRKATADTDWVSVEERLPWFNAHNPTSRPLLVEERHGTIIGWLSFEDFYGRPAYAATAEISIYIDAHHRGAGVGAKIAPRSDRAGTIVRSQKPRRVRVQSQHRINRLVPTVRFRTMG
jgi:phosphinothricin acetyltransferase